MALSLLIGGVSRHWKNGTLGIVETLGGRSTCDFAIEVLLGGGWAPYVGVDVVVLDGSIRLFAGSIESVETIRYHGNAAVLYRVSCIDHHRILDRRLAGEYNWQQRPAGQIVRDICANGLQGEGIDTAFVQDGPIIEEFSIDYPTVAEAIDQVARVAKMLWFIDYQKNLRFFAPETYSCPFELNDQEPNFSSLAVRSTREKYANRVLVRLGQYLRPEQAARFDAAGRSGELEEADPSLVPDGERTRFWVTHPLGAEPKVTVNGAPQSVGIFGADENRAWYWNLQSRYLQQDYDAAPLQSGDVLEVSYVGLDQSWALAENPAERDLRATIEGGTGWYETLRTVNDPTTRSQAQQLAESLLDQVDELSASAEITLNTVREPLASTARVGMRIHINVADYVSGGRSITAVEYGGPVRITAPAHGRLAGERVLIEGVPGAEGAWLIGNVTRDQFDLQGSTAAGTYEEGGWFYPLSYIIRQIRVYDVPGLPHLAYQMEAVAGPILGDAVEFFRGLATADGVPTAVSQPVPPGQSEVGNVTNLQASVEIKEGRVLIGLQGTAPEHSIFAGCYVFVEIPNEDDPDQENPGYPGELHPQGWHYSPPSEPGDPQIWMAPLDLPVPPREYLESLATSKVTWTLYALSRTWGHANAFVRHTGENLPVNHTPSVRITLDFTGYLAELVTDELGAVVLHGDPVVSQDSTGVQIEQGYSPPLYGVGEFVTIGDFEGVKAMIELADGTVLDGGSHPYTAIWNAPGQNVGQVRVRIPRPASLPATVYLHMLTEEPDRRHKFKKVNTGGGPPVFEGGYPVAVVEITEEALAFAPPTIASVTVAYRDIPGSKAREWRPNITLSGVPSSGYGGTDFDLLDVVAATWSYRFQNHAAGQPFAPVVSGDWYRVEPGESRTYKVKGWAYPASAPNQRVATNEVEVEVSLPIEDVIPVVAAETFTVSIPAEGGYTNGEDGEPYADVHVSWAIPAGADIITAYICERPYGHTPTPNVAEFSSLTSSTGTTFQTWRRRPREGARVFILLTAASQSGGVWRPPDASAPIKWVDIAPWGMPGAVTGASVSIAKTYLMDGAKYVDIAVNFTPPNSPDYWYTKVGRIWRLNANYDPLEGETYEKNGDFGERTSFRIEKIKLQATPEYHTWRFRPVDWRGTVAGEAHTVYANFTLPASDGLDLGATKASSIEGLEVAGGKLKPRTGDGVEVVDGRIRARLGSGLEAVGGQIRAKLGTGLEAADGAIRARLGAGLRFVDGRIEPSLGSDFLVDGSGNIAQFAVDLAKAYNYGPEFTKEGSALAIQAIAINKLLAGTALFSGNAVFASTDGSSLTIGGTGIVASRGGNQIAIGASSVSITGGGSTLTIASGGITGGSAWFTSLNASGGSITVWSGGMTRSFMDANGIHCAGSLSVTGNIHFSGSINGNVVRTVNGQNGDVTVTGEQGPPGPQGPQGPQGPKGDPGDNSTAWQVSYGNWSLANVADALDNILQRLNAAGI